MSVPEHAQDVATERMTKLLGCECAHSYQDTVYGRQRRVHNRTKQNKAIVSRAWRCTVCGKEKA